LYVWVPLIRVQQCNVTGYAGKITEGMMCAGEAGKDPCQVSLV